MKLLWLQADFVKLRKRFKAQAGSKGMVEKQCRTLQELCSKQRLEMDALRDGASQSGQCFLNSQPQPTNTSCVHFRMCC